MTIKEKGKNEMNEWNEFKQHWDIKQKIKKYNHIYTPLQRPTKYHGQNEIKKLLI